uniref:proheparin-binding EGF-like growth factor n=1 Tax=Pristiophorus japonicus TaxID=55135 RepID=UPI00398EE3D6
MVKLQALHQLLLLTAAGLWTVTGWPVDHAEMQLVSAGVPSPNLPTFSPSITQQLTTALFTDSSEEYYDVDDYEDEYDLFPSEELQHETLPAKVQPVVKPQPEDRKKKGSKKNKSKGKKKGTGRRKKKDPCRTTYKDYCIHGKCQYLKTLNKPSCVCLPGYQNERCGIQALLTGTNQKGISDLSVTLVVVAVILLVLILIAVAVIVTSQIRKKMRVEHDVVSEEKQKLGAETGIVV